MMDWIGEGSVRCERAKGEDVFGRVRKKIANIRKIVTQKSMRFGHFRAKCSCCPVFEVWLDRRASLPPLYFLTKQNN